MIKAFYFIAIIITGLVQGTHASSYELTLTISQIENIDPMILIVNNSEDHQYVKNIFNFQWNEQTTANYKLSIQSISFDNNLSIIGDRFNTINDLPINNFYMLSHFLFVNHISKYENIKSSSLSQISSIFKTKYYSIKKNALKLFTIQMLAFRFSIYSDNAENSAPKLFQDIMIL
jgi:hypothetical protein